MILFVLEVRPTYLEKKNSPTVLVRKKWPALLLRWLPLVLVLGFWPCSWVEDAAVVATSSPWGYRAQPQQITQSANLINEKALDNSCKFIVKSLFLYNKVTRKLDVSLSKAGLLRQWDARVCIFHSVSSIHWSKFLPLSTTWLYMKTLHHRLIFKRFSLLYWMNYIISGGWGAPAGSMIVSLTWGL